MAQVATTQEQSKILLDAGLDPNTADMCWITENHGVTYHQCPVAMPWRNYTAKEFYLPVWSFSALLDVMPKELRGVRLTYRLRIQYDGQYPMMYYVVTEGEFKGRLLRFGERCTPDAKNLFDAAVQIICWMLRDGIIEKKL